MFTVHMPLPSRGLRGSRALARVAACFLAVLLSVRAAVVINEIHYAPDVKTQHVQFIELYNSGTNSVDLTGWAFTSGVRFAFPTATRIEPGAYLLVAEDPASLQSKYHVTALGPWEGTLSKQADRVVLANGAGEVEDAVDYQLGFPWPTVGDPPGYSIELLNPQLDNNLGGSWRASVTGGAAPQGTVLIASGSEWRYLKGTAEASSPTTAWREPTFNDAAWGVGLAPVGYDSQVTMRTPLSDMPGNFISFFLRRTFVVENPATITALTLEALYDDGFKLWINGSNVLNVALPAGEVPYSDAAQGSARESNAYDTFAIDTPSSLLRKGTNIIAVQVHNILLSGSSDCFFDGRLTAQSGPTGRGPTPGRLNSVYAVMVPPQIRQVEHSPQQPASGVPVQITARVTHPEGVAGVHLLYQVVDPGNYIEITDPAYTTSWTAVPMNDAGTAGDALAGDHIYSATLPKDLQVHRRLVRYRIEAESTAGLSVTVPYADDPEPNFAYYVYNGVPAWTGAVKPGAAGTLGQTVTVPASEMNRLPVFQLIAKKQAVEESTWFSRYGGDAYPWVGTLVYDGHVYDHIHYRARGGVWRYSMCKNMWKFDFNRGHDLQVRDNWGRKYSAKWTKLNLGAAIQQGDYNHRGEQGMFESVGFRLFNLAGVPTCNTTFAQFRVVDAPQEVDSASQYEGDFWGLYLAVEQEDGRFLDEHGLPDANFYKMEGGTGELNNIGPYGPTDKSDLNRFMAGLNGSSTEAWWRTNWHLPNGYSYQAIVQAIHHFDIAAGKNYFYYRDPRTGLWTVHAWDLDLTWAENMYDAGGYGGEVFKSYALAKPALKLEFRNRVREIRDLLFNEDQAWQLIDEYAGRLRGPTNAPSILDADRSQWDYNPKMIDPAYCDNPSSKAGQGRYYRWPNEPTVSKDFNGCVQLMKNYVRFRSTNPAAQGSPLDQLSADTLIPSTPVVQYSGSTNFAVNRLGFRCSAFSGTGGFALLSWRIGEITRPMDPSWTADEPWKYEIESVWESQVTNASQGEVTVPSGVLKVGRTYRARARMTDLTGRTSHWSAPVEFVAGEPDNAQALADFLRLTEIMFQPPGGSDLEYVELHNASTNLALDLTGVTFTDGIHFTFPAGAKLSPGGYALVVRAASTDNFSAFRAYYHLDSSTALYGPYSGALADGGELLVVKTAPGGSEIVSLTYSDGRGWPVAAAGAGHSLVPLDSAMKSQAAGELNYGGNWRSSSFLGGSPGRADPTPAGGMVLNEIMAHTRFTDPAFPGYDSNDWIELFNPTAVPVRLLGWFLSDDPANLKKWALPDLTLPAMGWIVFDETTGFHQPITTGFGINEAGERLYLSFLTGEGQDRVGDAISFKGQPSDRSIGRYPDGGAEGQSLMPTRGSANQAATATAVISELMYHPPDLGTNQVDNVGDEYVELLNLTAGPLDLYTSAGPWRVDGSVEFSFPVGTVLPANGHALVVGFDPANSPTALASFRAHYGITGTNVPIYGPYQGKLPNSSGRVALEKPQAPDNAVDPISWVIVDEVLYADGPPWPVLADGAGRALRRVGWVGSGNEAAHWLAADPDPGSGSGPDESELLFTAASFEPDGVHLEFNRPAGKTVALEYNASLESGSAWLNLTNFPPPMTATRQGVVDSLGPDVGTRFYRLVTPSR